MSVVHASLADLSAGARHQGMVIRVLGCRVTFLDCITESARWKSLICSVRHSFTALVPSHSYRSLSFSVVGEADLFLMHLCSGSYRTYEKTRTNMEDV